MVKFIGILLIMQKYYRGMKCGNNKLSQNYHNGFADLLQGCF